ncbi:MAG: DNA topoisomerase 3 [Clostridiales bacterium]|nr:DNA topoisomerase 3 [Clostridiales bacterium]
MKLVIAEKPSAAQSISKVIGANERNDGYLQGNGYIVSWCYGHLVGLAEPDSYGDEYKSWSNVPILPEKWNYVVNESTKKQFNVLKNLMNHATVESIVCAADAGREGELIFRHVYNMAGCKKPFERLWISSLEDSAIAEGFKNLKDGRDYDNLYASALCRERADWLVGMNMTRFFSTLYNSTKPLSIGRVQTPTLSMIAGRDSEISSFVKKKYYTVQLNCGLFTAESEKLADLKAANEVLEKCSLSHAVVKDVIKEKKHTSPPKLYDLTTLQRDANRIFGFTAQQTLEAVQNLYDNKIATYPRTDSRYLTEDMEETARNIIGIIKENFSFAKNAVNEPNIAVVMDNSKVSDHHAIIPTVNVQYTNLNQLRDTDRKVLFLIAHRLLTATAESYEYENTKATLDCSGISFTARGKTVIHKGFKALEEEFFAYIKAKPDGEKSAELPDVSEGDLFSVTAKLAEHYTQPPKNYTEDTLLSSMERAGNSDYDTDDVERKGLGTPATRAGIIETLIKRGYAERKGKSIVGTEKGKKLVMLMPDSLKSAKMTAEWENRLALISKGQADSDSFMKDISGFVTDVISSTKVNEEMNDAFNERKSIGVCPRCGGNIYEGKLNFYCENKDCSLALWKDNKFFSIKKKTITAQTAKSLLEKGKVHFNDLYSEKTGKTYAADILLDDTGGKYVNFKLEFTDNKKEFTDNKKGGASDKSKKAYTNKNRYPQKYPQKGALTR